MKIHNEYSQNSVEWLWARCGVVTASEMDNLVTDKFNIRNGEMVNSYLARKVAEAWSGPLPSFTAFSAEQGSMTEGEANRAYTMETGQEITPVGFITMDDGRVGCSPDGMLGDDCGIEIKSPNADTHVKYLLNGELPPQYAPQVQGSMYVTGFASWKFMSYRRHFPPLILTVRRDAKAQEAISKAIESFLVTFENAMIKMESIDGAPRPKLVRPIHSPEIQSEESIEIIP